MIKSRLFYVVEAQFYVSLGVNGKRLKTITKYFNSTEPREDRKEAIKFFNEIRDKYLIKTGADCRTSQEVYVEKLKENNPECKSIYDIRFINSNNFQIALVLSYAIRNGYYENKYDEYHGNLIPICAVGASLKNIEDELLINLHSELCAYQVLGYKTYQEIKVTNTLDKGFLLNYFTSPRRCGLEFILSNVKVFSRPSLYEQEFDLMHNIKMLSRAKEFKIFPNPQHEKRQVENTNSEAKESYIDFIDKKILENYKDEFWQYENELKNLNNFYRMKLGKKIDLIHDKKLNFRLMYGKHKEDYFFTKNQIAIHKKIADSWIDFTGGFYYKV